MEKILSVSVACYNLGDMILENLESFCESELAEKIEVIVTDDGSKDNTPDIVEKYAQQYPSVIKLIRKKNEGPGSTVNSGIKNATGKYFRMVDGDDWVDTKNLTEFVKFLETCDSDMVISDYQLFDDSIKKLTDVKSFNLQPKLKTDFSEVYKNLSYEMHAITYKTSILKTNNITLDNCFYTDVEYALYPIPFIKTVSYFNKIVYIYRIGQAGQSVNVKSLVKNYDMHNLVLNHLISFANNLNTAEKNKQYIIKRIADMADNQLFILLNCEISKATKNQVRQFIKYIKTTFPDGYKLMKKGKKVKALILTNFALYRLLAKKIQRS